MNIYLTADQIGTPTGGGAVTYHESEALKSLGPCLVIGRKELADHAEKLFSDPGAPVWNLGEEPWFWDNLARDLLENLVSDVKIAHVYAGTFSRTIGFLKSCDIKVAYTAAAHDKDLSRKEHEKLGHPFQYPHLVEPNLWQRYLAGYLAADVLVTPSRHSADVMRGYGYTGLLKVIPHGCYLPERVAPLPDRFTVGYLGAIGPDKGIRYLLEAWGNLNYQDGSVLLLGGAQSKSPLLANMIGYFCKNDQSVQVTGWLDNVSAFYNSISLYVQPSVTEGFGMEVLEALAYGRPVIATTGCGASDLLSFGQYSARVVEAGNVDELVDAIDMCKTLGYPLMKKDMECNAYLEAPKYTWDRIRQQYIDLWKSL